MMTAPASRSRATTVASSAAGPSAYPGQAAVVAMPATSMLFFTAATSPASGNGRSDASTASASASASANGRSVIQISGRAASAMAA